jgi:IS5 family transposase
VKDLLAERRLFLQSGTIVDATIIAAPSSTKNATKSRDPERKQTRKGGSWHFGMKLHMGTDRRGIVHSVTGTHAAASDISQLPELLHGEERVVWGDPAYRQQADREAFEKAGIRSRMNRRAPGGNKNLSVRWRTINRARSRTRACCEHPFRVVKQLWGFEKTRYRGIAKSRARAQTMFALANLYAVRHRLLPPQARCAL